MKIELKMIHLMISVVMHYQLTNHDDKISEFLTGFSNIFFFCFLICFFFFLVLAWFGVYSELSLPYFTLIVLEITD